MSHQQQMIDKIYLKEIEGHDFLAAEAAIARCAKGAAFGAMGAAPSGNTVAIAGAATAGRLNEMTNIENNGSGSSFTCDIM